METKKYNVVFSISYQIEAEDEETAIGMAENDFIDEVGNAYCGLTEMFGILVEEVDE